MFAYQSVFNQELRPDSIQFKVDTVYFIKKKQLEKAYDAQSPGLIAEKLFNLGEYYQEALLFSEAIEQYNEALRTTSKKDSLRVKLYNNIASIHLLHKNFREAKYYLQKAIQISKEINFMPGLGIAEGALGTCYEKEGDYLKALEHQKNSADIFDKLGDQLGKAMVNENIGSIYEDLEQFDRALYYFMKSNSFYKKFESENQISVLNNLGDIYRKTGKYQNAIVYTTNALNLAKEYKNLSEQESAYKDLSEIYVEIRDFEKAYRYLHRYDEIQNELQYSESLKQLYTLQAIYDTREKEAQIDLLTKQNQIKEANQNLLLGGTAALVILSGIFYFNLQRKRRDQNRVQQYEQELLKTQLDKKAIEEKKLNGEIHLKTASLTKYSLNIAQKNKLISDLAGTLNKIAGRPKMEAHQKIKSLARELETNLEQTEEWDEFMGYFKEIHPQFFEKLNALAKVKLTSTEFRLAMLLRLKMSSKEIASILRITPDSVRVARYRFRKKLPIKSEEKLAQFLQDL